MRARGLVVAAAALAAALASGCGLIFPTDDLVADGGGGGSGSGSGGGDGGGGADDGTTSTEGGCPEAGTCLPEPITASGAAETKDVGSIAVDDTNVYWSETTTGGVFACPLAGCGGSPPSTVMTGLGTGRINRIAVSGGRLFAADGVNDRVVACALPACGSSPAIFASNQPGAFFVRVLGSAVYWIDDGNAAKNASVFSCALGDTCATPATIATEGGDVWGTMGFAVDATYAYWTDGYRLLRCPLTGCGNAPTVLQSSGTLDIAGIAVDASHLYWLSQGSLMTCPVPNCNNDATTLAPMDHGAAVVSDGARVYFTDFGSNGVDGRILECASAGCATPTTISRRQHRSISRSAARTSTGRPRCRP
jgi:hypothetical protein